MRKVTGIGFKIQLPSLLSPLILLRAKNMHGMSNKDIELDNHIPSVALLTSHVVLALDIHISTHCAVVQKMRQTSGKEVASMKKRRTQRQSMKKRRTQIQSINLLSSV
jgi:hypothetical protein